MSNGLYRTWDDQFYPDGLKGWVTLLEARPEGGLSTGEGFFTESDQRLHQIHLEGGDASSDSYCFS